MLKLLSKNLQKKKKKKKKKKRKENNCSSPKNTPYCTAWKIGKINEYVLYVKKESNMQINIDNYVKLLSIFFFISLENI